MPAAPQRGSGRRRQGARARGTAAGGAAAAVLAAAGGGGSGGEPLSATSDEGSDRDDHGRGAGRAALNVPAAGAGSGRPPRHPPVAGDGALDRPTAQPPPAAQPPAAIHKSSGSYADVGAALHSMARGVGGPSRLGGPTGVSPYDTPSGSPRLWRPPPPPARGGGGLMYASAAWQQPQAQLRRRADGDASYGALSAAAAAAPPGRQTTLALDPGRDLYPRLEAMAASAVRTAHKVGAALIVVLSHTGTAARLVSKYRPRQRVLALTVPRLGVAGGVRWKLEGRGDARRCLLSRGVVPLLWCAAAYAFGAAPRVVP